jgi:glycosyltransferase involved in cell wall biosynthesis
LTELAAAYFFNFNRKHLKIIIVNYRYFISGGPERYLFNITGLLEKNGHEIIPFSVKNKLNRPSRYENYFLNPIGGDNEVYFSEYKKTNIKTILKSFSRMFYSLEAKRKLSQLIKDVAPDLIYVLHYQNKISASIFDAAAKNKIPVVQRISDFGQICANALFYRPTQKDICERCLTGSKMNAISNKCVYDSYIYSAIKAASLKFQEIINVTKKVQAFVVPSKFTIEKLNAYGISEQYLVHIPTFFNFKTISKAIPLTYEPFALYVGRIEPEKGLMTLVRSFENTEFNLKIIGFSNSGFEQELKEYLKDKQHHIEFLGRKDFDDIQIYLSKCSFTIVPSEWYDNFPNSILESFAFKKCVIATNTGSLKELVIENNTGLLFKIKDVQDLRNKIAYLFSNNAICKSLGENAFDLLNKEYSAPQHYNSLIKLFSNVIKDYSKAKLT